jgi:hypothetical protein
MDTKHFKIAADIGPSDPAGIAVAARDHWIDDSPIAWSKALDPCTYSFDNACELVPDDTRITSERVRAVKDMDV